MIQVFSIQWGFWAEPIEFEEEYSQDTAHVAWMLIGSMAFVMAMFYLVNHPDPDMMRCVHLLFVCNTVLPATRTPEKRLSFWREHKKRGSILRYSWQVISSTISIFIAVLVFQGVNGLLQVYVVQLYPDAIFWKIGINFSHQIVW